ncbi:MAG: DMT family transporter [Anaerolineae bacterium]|nr:DMT family transporter [Anaerolineae bacterium]
MPITTHNKTQLTRGYAVALASAAVLSTTAIFIRHLTQTYQMPPLVLAFWRDIFVVLTMLLALRRLKPEWLRLERRHLPFFAGYGLVLAGFNTLWTFSVAFNGAASSTVLAYTSAGFTALLGWWLLKERLDWVKILVIAVSLGGCALVADAFDPAAWRINLAGILTGMSSGLFYALYSLMGRTASQRGLNPWTSLIYTFGFAAGFLLCFNLVGPGTLATKVAQFAWLGTRLPGWGILFLLAAGPTVIGFGLYNTSLSYLPSSVANLIVTLEPAFTAVMATVLLGERISAMQIGGGLMIMGSVAFLRLYEEQRAKSSAASPDIAAVQEVCPALSLPE